MLLKVFSKVCFKSDFLCLLSLFSKGDALAKRGYVMAILIVRISLMRIIARAICVDHQNTHVLMIPPSAYSLRSSAMGEEIVLMDLMKAIFVVLLLDTFFLIILDIVCHNTSCWKNSSHVNVTKILSLYTGYHIGPSLVFNSCCNFQVVCC